MKKTVLGLNLDYFIRSMIFSMIAMISVFLPYTSAEGQTYSLLGAVMTVGGAAEKSPLFILIILAACISVASGIVSLLAYRWTSVNIVRIWTILLAVQTAAYTILMFSTKIIMETSGIYSDFLNSHLGIGYWLGIIASYVALIFAMKMAGINRGYIILTIMGVIWVFPILWIVLTALRAEQGYYVGYFFPHKLTFRNFIDLFSNQSVLPFGRWWVNTMIVAMFSCVINTLIILGTSFTLSRTRFSGRKAFMNILMIIGMFPGFMSLIAVYNILKGLGMNQSLLALIVVSAAGAAMGYHISKGFFDTIPKAVDEAALIDGASRLQIFFRIILPLSKSIIVYTVLGNFLAAWSDYIFPSMLFGDKQSSYTVAVGLYWLTDFRRIDTYYTQFAAGAVVVAIPIVILFVWLQRFYVEGLSGAVKG